MPPATSADSLMNTLNVPTQGTSPALLYRAAERPLRVVVRNVGGAAIVLAHDANALSVQNPTAGTYRLAIGDDVTIVLMAKQSVLAVAVGAGGLVSVAISEALPQVWAER